MLRVSACCRLAWFQCCWSSGLDPLKVRGVMRVRLCSALQIAVAALAAAVVRFYFLCH